VVLFDTGAAQKYVEVLDARLPELALDAVDRDRLAGL
jgi:hypothetical protein